MSKEVLAKVVDLVLGDQLFPLSLADYKKADLILMIEDYGLCTHFRYHKHKIIFFLASMRRYRQELEKSGFATHYYDLENALFKQDFEKKLDDFFSKNKMVKEVRVFEVADQFFALRLQEYFSKKNIKLTTKINPMFLTTKQEFSQYLDVSKKPFMMTFYSQQRSRLQVLIDKKGNPEGGQWSFDKENRKKYPKNVEIPRLLHLSPDPTVEAVKSLVEKNFTDHPGHSENFWLPTCRQEGLQWLDHFIDFKFQSFGPYEDAISGKDVFGFHSVISPLLNIGLILPAELVETLVDKSKSQKIPIASVEGYVRQVIG